jgi:hypothetical protein
MNKLRVVIENFLFLLVIVCIIALCILAALVTDGQASAKDEDVVLIVKYADKDGRFIQAQPVFPVVVTLTSDASLSRYERGASIKCRARTVDSVNGSHLQLRCPQELNVVGMDFNAH